MASEVAIDAAAGEWNIDPDAGNDAVFVENLVLVVVGDDDGGRTHDFADESEIRVLPYVVRS